MLNLVRLVVALAVAALLLAFTAIAVVIGGSSVLTAVLVSLAAGALLAGGLWLRRARDRSTRAVPRGPHLGPLRRAAETILALSAVGAVTALVANGFALRPPRQAQVAARFSEHRQECEQLREMVAADKLVGVLDGGSLFAREDFAFREPGALGLDPERVGAYERLMRKVGSSRIDVWRSGAVSFAVAGWGGASRGWRVGLVFSPPRPHPTVESIDGFRKAKGRWEQEWAYSPIGEDWYVYITW